jgi:tetraacyldisaccharide 4'-kinase
VPVISVGNLTTGGTGKTPIVAWVVELLQQQGRRPGIVSRGYRSLDGQENDEKRLLDALCPGVPHIQNPDRVPGAKRAIAESHCDVLVLDDGFQHRRLARDLDIVLIDALNPWGYGHLLPRGLLREPPSSLCRAGIVCLTRVAQCDPVQRQAIRDIVRTHSAAPIAEVSFVPTRLVSVTGETWALEGLASQAVGACCAIGNPSAFFRTLNGLDVPLSDDRQRTYPDHHHYSEGDIDSLGRWADVNRLDVVVVTRKDLVKLPVERVGPARVLALDIGVHWNAGQADVDESIRAATVRERAG